MKNSIIDKKIQMYEDALEACYRRIANGSDVTEDISYLRYRIKQFKQDKKRGLTV